MAAIKSSLQNHYPQPYNFAFALALFLQNNTSKYLSIFIIQMVKEWFSRSCY